MFSFCLVAFSCRFLSSSPCLSSLSSLNRNRSRQFGFFLAFFALSIDAEAWKTTLTSWKSDKPPPHIAPRMCSGCGDLVSICCSYCPRPRPPSMLLHSAQVDAIYHGTAERAECVPSSLGAHGRSGAG